MHVMFSVVIAAGLVLLGMRSVPVIIPYSPLSLVVASNSHFHDVQLSHLSLGLTSLNLCILCLGCEMGMGVA